MSIKQIKEEIKQILIIIETYYDKMVETMCSGDGYIEQEYSDLIDYWEEQKESLELILN